MTPITTYDAAAHGARRPTTSSAASGTAIDVRELMRLASLAASSHNTQPWRFVARDREIRILPDFTRRCPVVDPDDAHLYKSLGCAAENIVHAAAARGARAEVGYDDDLDEVVVRLTPDPTSRETELARAIPERQCTKTRYDGTPLDDERLDVLRRAGTHGGVRALVFVTDEDKLAITEFVNRGNRAQLSDPAWRRELLEWIRPNDRAAVAHGDGLAGRTSGQPSVPTWLAPLVLRLVVRPRVQAATDTANIESSAGIMVLVSDRHDRAAWVEVGRCYERFALQSTAMGVRNAFINQPIEVPQIRPRFEQWLGLAPGEHAQLMVRFGTGPQMPYSLRRPLDDVISGPT